MTLEMVEPSGFVILLQAVEQKIITDSINAIGKRGLLGILDIITDNKCIHFFKFLQMASLAFLSYGNLNKGFMMGINTTNSIITPFSLILRVKNLINERKTTGGLDSCSQKNSVILSIREGIDTNVRRGSREKTCSRIKTGVMKNRWFEETFIVSISKGY